MLILFIRMETLKRHLPFSGQDGLQELKKIAVRFEEKIYTAATSQVYLSHDFYLTFFVSRPNFIFMYHLLFGQLELKPLLLLLAFFLLLQSDYLRKISLKMLTMETKSQNPIANSLQSNAASNSKNPQDPGRQNL